MKYLLAFLVASLAAGIGYAQISLPYSFPDHKDSLALKREVKVETGKYRSMLKELKIPDARINPSDEDTNLYFIIRPSQLNQNGLNTGVLLSENIIDDQDIDTTTTSTGYELIPFKVCPNAGLTWGDNSVITGAFLSASYQNWGKSGATFLNAKINLTGTSIPKDSAIAISNIVSNGGDLSLEYIAGGYRGGRHWGLGGDIRGKISYASYQGTQIGFGSFAASLQLGTPILYIQSQISIPTYEILNSNSTSRDILNTILINTQFIGHLNSGDYFILSVLNGENIEPTMKISYAKEFEFFKEKKKE